MILDATFLEKLDVLAKRLMATTDFHPDAHTVLEAGIMLAMSLDRIVAAERQLDAIAKALDYPAESWKIAGCDFLAHAVADLQRNYIALRDSAGHKEWCSLRDPLYTGECDCDLT